MCLDTLLVLSGYRRVSPKSANCRASTKACSMRLKQRPADRQTWVDRDGEEFNGDYKACSSQVCLTVTLVLCFSNILSQPQHFITATTFSDSLNPLGKKMRMSGQQISTDKEINDHVFVILRKLLQSRGDPKEGTLAEL